MVWKEFLAPVLASHGKKVVVARPAGQAGGDSWALDSGSLFTLVVGPQTLEFRADDGYLIQLEEEYLTVHRDKPLHEATFVFYPHISAFRIQKADLAGAEHEERESLMRSWD